MSGRPRGDKTSKAARAVRQAKAVEMMNAGVKKSVIREELGISRMAFWRDLQAIEARYIDGSSDDVRKFKAAQLAALMRLEEATVKGEVDPATAQALIRIRDSVAKLLGLNAESRAVVAHVSTTVEDPKTLGRYRRFCFETRHLSDADLERVYEFCRTLNVPPPRVQLQFPVKPELWGDWEPESGS